MKKLITFISFLFFVGLTMAQHQNVQLPYSGSSYAPEEPAIYVNPYNTDKLVAGANINNVYISNDGGFTWDANGNVVQATQKVAQITMSVITMLRLQWEPGLLPRSRRRF